MGVILETIFRSKFLTQKKNTNGLHKRLSTKRSLTIEGILITDSHKKHHRQPQAIKHLKFLSLKFLRLPYLNLCLELRPTNTLHKNVRKNLSKNLHHKLRLYKLRLCKLRLCKLRLYKLRLHKLRLYKLRPHKLRLHKLRLYKLRLNKLRLYKLRPASKLNKNLRSNLRSSLRSILYRQPQAIKRLKFLKLLYLNLCLKLRPTRDS